MDSATFWLFVVVLESVGLLLQELVPDEDEGDGEPRPEKRREEESEPPSVLKLEGNVLKNKWKFKKFYRY